MKDGMYLLTPEGEKYIDISPKVSHAFQNIYRKSEMILWEQQSLSLLPILEREKFPTGPFV
jgi:hypothetical protein